MKQLTCQAPMAYLLPCVGDMTPRISGITLRLLAVLFAILASPLRAQASPCLSDADSLSLHISRVTHQVFAGDSTRLVSQGLPFRPPQGVSQETDSQVCLQMITALNNLWPPSDSAQHVSQAYVLKVGADVHALIRRNSDVYYYLDANGSVLASILILR